MKKLLAFASITTMLASPAFAGIGDVIPTGLELGLGLSATTGVNGFVGYANKNFESFWWKRLGVRFDFASTKPIKSKINSTINSFIDDGIEIDDLKISDLAYDGKHFAALVDFYPFGNTWFLGGWRVSTGYVFGKVSLNALVSSDVDTSGLAGREFELNGTQYKYFGGDLHAKAKTSFDFSGPYFGTGFDLGIYHGFKLFLDAGVVFTNKSAELGLNIPETGLKYKDGGGDWQPVNTAMLQTDIDKTIADAQDELDKYKFFPMVKLGFMYRF